MRIATRPSRHSSCKATPPTSVLASSPPWGCFRRFADRDARRAGRGQHGGRRGCALRRVASQFSAEAASVPRSSGRPTFADRCARFCSSDASRACSCWWRATRRCVWMRRLEPEVKDLPQGSYDVRCALCVFPPAALVTRPLRRRAGGAAARGGPVGMAGGEHGGLLQRRQLALQHARRVLHRGDVRHHVRGPQVRV